MVVLGGVLVRSSVRLWEEHPTNPTLRTPPRTVEREDWLLGFELNLFERGGLFTPGPPAGWHWREELVSKSTVWQWPGWDSTIAALVSLPTLLLFGLAASWLALRMGLRSPDLMALLPLLSMYAPYYVLGLLLLVAASGAGLGMACLLAWSYPSRILESPLLMLFLLPVLVPCFGAARTTAAGLRAARPRRQPLPSMLIACAVLVSTGSSLVAVRLVLWLAGW